MRVPRPVHCAPAILTIVALSGCAHDVQLTNLSDSTQIQGTSTFWNQTVTLTMPSGEVVEGRYEPLTTASIGEGSLFWGSNLGALMGTNTSGRAYGYARLTGSTGTVIEIVFSTDWTGHGFGVAKTSSGEEYRVMF